MAKVPAAKAPAAKPSPKAPATTGAVTSSTAAARRIAIDGVSLTINGVSDDGFDVCLIPHTLSKTHLPELKVGDGVNLESDVIGKYVKRLLSRGGGGPTSSVDEDLLRRAGFLR